VSDLADDCRRIAASPSEHSLADALALIARLAEALDQKSEISGPVEPERVDIEWKKPERRRKRL
jgi:hypothetical protein